MEDILDITLQVTRTFEALDINYFVGGSLASSLHGIPRATRDVDIVADIEEEQVEAFVERLRKKFYVDAPMIRSAIAHRSTFHIIYLPTMFKIDIFVMKDDEVSQNELKRRQTYVVTKSPQRKVVVASPEDTIVHKLYWYRLGDEVSDRQWQDALGVLKVYGRRLDFVYLRQAALALGVPDLLEKV